MEFDPKAVETVTVDSYGTLVDPSSIQETLSKYVDDPIAISNLWFSRALMNKLVANSIGAYEPFDVLSKDGLIYALDYYDAGLNETEIDEILSSYNSLDVFDGVREGLNTIHEKGYEIYIISNGTTTMLQKLAVHVGIEDIVSGEVSADEIKRYKPDAEIYRHTAARTGTPIDRVLHVSGPYFDVLGAMHAGMQGGWINYKDNPRDTFASEPNIEIESFNEIADVLPDRNG